MKYDIKTYTVAPDQCEKLFGTFDHVPTHCYKSEYLFHTFTNENNQEFLFKKCDSAKLIGEVVYSNLGKLLGINCAENSPAILNDNGIRFPGISSKNFLAEGERFRAANSYFRQLSKIPHFHRYISDLGNLNLEKLISIFAKIFPHNSEQIRHGLVENFLMHTIANTADVCDLHNIGFLLSPTSARTSPPHDFSPVPIYSHSAILKPRRVHQKNAKFLQSHCKETVTQILDNAATIRGQQNLIEICDVTPLAPLMPCDYNIKDLSRYSEEIYKSINKNLDIVAESFAKN